MPSSSSHLSPIEQAFGAGCDLYTTVLGCASSGPRVTAAQIRKAYYRAALRYHPDKAVVHHHHDNNKPENDGAPPLEEATTAKFLAVSMAYQILSDATARADYDDTHEIPRHAPGDVDDDVDEEMEPTADGVDLWKRYFDRMFGANAVTGHGIDAFAAQYKCSDEERRDVVRECQRRDGHLLQMLPHVMLSELVDVPRWFTDYIEPALALAEAGASEVTTTQTTTSRKTTTTTNPDEPVLTITPRMRQNLQESLRTCHARLAKEQAKQNPRPCAQRKSSSRRSTTPQTKAAKRTKTGPTKTKNNHDPKEGALDDDDDDDDHVENEDYDEDHDDDDDDDGDVPMVDENDGDMASEPAPAANLATSPWIPKARPARSAATAASSPKRSAIKASSLSSRSSAKYAAPKSSKSFSATSATHEKANRRGHRTTTSREKGDSHLDNMDRLVAQIHGRGGASTTASLFAQIEARYAPKHTSGQRRTKTAANDPADPLTDAEFAQIQATLRPSPKQAARSTTNIRSSASSSPTRRKK